MSKAYDLNLQFISLTNSATTTIPVYSFVRLNTTNLGCDLITTRGTVPAFGVAHEAINPSDSGKVATDGFSRVKMGSTGYTTMAVTTPNWIGANASGKGVRLTTTSGVYTNALGLVTFAASDIVTVKLIGFNREPGTVA